jgi:hypothetical protein
MRDFDLSEMNDNAHMLGNPFQAVQDIRRVTIGIHLGRVPPEALAGLVLSYSLTVRAQAEAELNRRDSL